MSFPLPVKFTTLESPVKVVRVDPMKELDIQLVHTSLNAIMEAELAGVVRYTHYSLMVTGPHRLPIVSFLKAQATESLLHAQQVGEVLTGIDGHPSLSIATIEETHQHSIKAILLESLQHERAALQLYMELLNVVDGVSVYLEEFARTKIGEEELHVIELRKMVRDYGTT
jgi:bacterioferritin